MNDAITVSEAILYSDRDAIGFTVRIDRSMMTHAAPDIIFPAVADGVSAYVEKNVAPDLYKILEGPLVSELVADLSKKLLPEILKRLDLDAVAKLATLNLGKRIGIEANQ